MSKVDIKRLDSVTKNDTTATEQINDNFQALQAAIENTVSRDGTVPNYMDADLDLNSYRIINAGDPVGECDVVTLKYFEEKAGGTIEAAAEAKASASKAASSAQSALVASNNAIGQLAQAEGLLIAAEGQLEDTKQYIDAAKSDIDSTVAQAKADVNSAIDEATTDISNTSTAAISTINTAVSNAESNISTIVSDAEGSITNIAVTEANKAIANAAQEATNTATANVNSYVDGTIKPSLQTYVDQAQEDASSAATSMEQSALSATAASNYASNASADADNASESAGMAANSAAAAATSETNAKTSETSAKIWAEGTDAQVQALGGEKSAKGWAEASTNLDYTNITNCITEIPQDINIELNSGTLTLKAGSKIYVPNGANVYNAVTIPSDMILPKNSSAKYFVFLKDNGAAADTMPVDYCYTGKFEPTITHTYAIWYDTYSYKIKWTGDNGSTWVDGYSLPMCVVVNDTPGTEKVSSKQVFNGFGYIGKTLVFALPGVKGLIPNGRNADGSLKNIEFRYDNVTLTTFTKGVLNEHIACLQDGIALSPTPIVYDEEVNLNRVGSSYRNDMCDAGRISIDSAKSYAITSFTPKTAFHAVDRNDLVHKLNSKQDIATAVNYDNITNCIAEIPQDIKLDLNNGTLTLKAGSKVYVPNGKNIVGSLRFKETVIESDISLTQSWGSSQTFLLFYDTKGLRLRIYDTGRCYSGTTSVSDGAYYNTNDNKLYVYDGGSLNFTASLPIAIITGQSPTITSIDQVFNGFGYIGSTVFALPGVKGLIPNGRNADGSLKNIEFTTNKVFVRTYAQDYTGTGILGFNPSLEIPFSMSGGVEYNEIQNINLDVDGEKVSEYDVEQYLNFDDNTAALNKTVKSVIERTYSKKKVDMLKRLYAYRCQICGQNVGEEHGVNIAEAHHIKYFSKSVDNSSDNLLILCPNHHSLIHALNPEFDYDELQYIYPDGTIDKIVLDLHLTRGKEEE